jgi:hypothetical protein
LASALRALDERVAVGEKLRDKAIESQHTKSVGWWQRRIDETRREADTIRESIIRLARLVDEKAGD